MRLRSKPSIVVISFSEFFQFFGRNQIVLCRSFFALHHLFTPSILQATRRMQHVPFWTAKPTHGSNICLCLMKRFLVCNILQKIPKKKNIHCYVPLQTTRIKSMQIHAAVAVSISWIGRSALISQTPLLPKQKERKKKRITIPLIPNYKVLISRLTIRIRDIIQ